MRIWSHLRRHKTIFIILFLVLSTLVSYWQLMDNGFISLDDSVYITANPDLHKGLTGGNIGWVFTFLPFTYWHPLTWLSFALDYELFGLNPAGYHMVNLLFHVTNAILLFFILNLMTGRLWASAFAAFLFALHPINVESVAWVVERKSVLSGLFWMLTIWMYYRYVKHPCISRYTCILITMMLGLMAKPTLVTIPFVLLLLDYWPLGRLRPGNPGTITGTADGDTSRIALQPSSLSHLVLEKVPLLCLSFLSVFITLISNPIEELGDGQVAASVGNKVSNALVSYSAYIGKLFWPSKLAVYYPLQDAYPAWQVAGAVILLTGITFYAILKARSTPWLVTGWLWYLGVSIPTIGLVRDGLWPEMADRFAYLPFIGLFVIIAWGFMNITAHWRHRGILLSGGAAFILTALMARTYTQVGLWQSSLSLFEHAAEVTESNSVAYIKLGDAYLLNGNYQRALEVFAKEKKLDPFSLGYEYAQGVMHYKRGEFTEAINVLEGAYLKDNNNLNVLFLSGKIYEQVGVPEKAIDRYNGVLLSPYLDDKHFRARAGKALQRLLNKQAPDLDGMQKKVSDYPLDLKARGELAVRLQVLGLYDEALNHYLVMERLGMKAWQLPYNIGNVYLKLKKYEEAVRYFETSLSLNPSNADTLNNLGIVYRKMKEPARAIATFMRAISLDPELAFAHFNIASTYYQTGELAKALRHFRDTQARFPHLEGRIRPYMKSLRNKMKE